MSTMSHEKAKETKEQLPTSGLATSGLVCGIFSVLLFWFPGVHFILGTLAITFGAITFRKKRFGVSALVLGIVGFAFVALYFLSFFVYAAMAAAGPAAVSQL